MCIISLDPSPRRVSRQVGLCRKEPQAFPVKDLERCEEVPRTSVCLASPGVMCDLEKPWEHSGILTRCGGGREEGRETRLMRPVTPHLRCEGCLEAMSLRLTRRLWKWQHWALQWLVSFVGLWAGWLSIICVDSPKWCVKCTESPKGEVLHLKIQARSVGPPGPRLRRYWDKQGSLITWFSSFVHSFINSFNMYLWASVRCQAVC